MKKLTTFIYIATVAAVGLFGIASTPAQAATDCTFTTVGTTDFLDADCTTDATIFVPDGFTLDGQDYAITAVDPAASHFVGGVVENGGSVAHVTHLFVNTDSLANTCDAGGDRLRGIMFEGASGSITHNTVENINQGASGCQEGNAIEVRNVAFDGTHPDTQAVEIAHNVLNDYQKGGIICNGDVDCWIHHNMVGASATQQNLAANAVQIGFGASGFVEHNHIAGNEWLGASNFAATAVLVFSNTSGVVSKNNIGGNADVGIFLSSAEDTTVDNNRVFESGVDGPHGDYGIVDVSGTNNAFTNNKVRGYDSPAGAFPDVGQITGTKVIPSPQDPQAACFLPDTSAQAC